VLGRMTAHATSDLDFAGEPLPTAGKRFTVPFALFLTVTEAGTISHVARVRDNLSVARQLDLPAERMKELFAKFERRPAV
jgi:hypothetical protein